MSKKVLVACEYSQIVMTEFLKLGADAYSCDIIPAEGEYPKRHLRMNAQKAVLLQDWDLVIAHPPCTYLSNMTSHIMFKGGEVNAERYLKMLDARDFFMFFWLFVKCKLAIENPIPMKICSLPAYTQIVNPTMFGDEYSKKTCLWLRDLPPLLPTTAQPAQFKSFVYSCRGSHNRSKLSKFLAEQMALQWYPCL